MRKRLPSRRRLGAIRLLLVDVDGVLTDGSIVYSSDGEALKTFNTKDGYGIVEAKGKGLEVGIITGRSSPIVTRRAQDLGISELHQGAIDKEPVLRSILERRGLKKENIAYIGDDEPDLPVIRAVGFSAAPSDAISSVRRAVMYVCVASGGRGAVREVIDLLLRAR